ncbi:MAG: hypothetical protein U5L98_17300 [Halomonas sp.]|nr:hypothetical protein [Halomonas sp.]MDZ7854332.1 hypothetical protein [Halomonas sp.]
MSLKVPSTDWPRSVTDVDMPLLDGRREFGIGELDLLVTLRRIR